MSKLRSIEWIHDEIQTTLRRSQSGITLTCFSEEGNRERKLFETDTSKLTVSQNEDRDRTLAAIDRAGIRVPYRCEVYPSASSQLSEKQKQLGVMYSNLDKKFANFPQFSE